MIIPKTLGQSQSYSDLKMVYDTLPFEDAFTHQIWNSYLKEYRRYAPDSMPILESKSEVKIKVKETPRIVCDTASSKIYAHTRFWIPTSNNRKEMRQTQILLKNRSDVKVTVTRKWYATLHHPKMHLHTKFGIPTSKNIGDMLRTRFF